MATTPGVRARDNDHRGKASLLYNGHRASSYGAVNRALKWRRWRRAARAWLRSWRSD